MKLLVNFLRDENGATAIEYALIAGLLSIAIIGGASAVGVSVNRTFTNISGAL